MAQDSQVVEVNQAVKSNDETMFLSSRCIDVREFRYIVPISNRLPDSIDFLGHIEVADGKITRLAVRATVGFR